MAIVEPWLHAPCEKDTTPMTWSNAAAQQRELGAVIAMNADLSREWGRTLSGRWERVGVTQKQHASAPEILVTEEMINAGRDAWHEHIEEETSAVTTFEVVYRAMAAVAPKQVTREPDVLQSQVEYWKQRFQGQKAGCETAEERCVALEAELTALRLQLAAQAPAAFGPATDTADPPRRPDGTLAPAARPLPTLRPGRDTRRIGG